ncbi:MAG TPA: DMT family transporter [Alphaproteobacteria bacterium]|nr:DMT family transporter [Alphaproteobacteria bacterium]
MTQATTTARLDRPLAGIAFVIAGVTVFTTQDVIIKLLSGDYPVLEIVFVRSVVSLPLLFALASLRGGRAALWPRHPLQQALRGLVMFLSYVTYYMALAALPLAEAVSIFYSAPLFMTALSGPLLGEYPGVRRWSAVAVGFLGVLVILRPQGELSLAALLAVASAATYAFSALITRRIGAGDSAESMAMSASLVYVALALVAGLTLGDGRLAGSNEPEIAFLLRAWSWPTPGDFALFALCGLIAAIGFTCLAQAYRTAPAPSVAPFEYSSLPWAVLWGWVIWSDFPDPWLWLGIALVVGSGVYVFRREAARTRERTE